MSELRYHPFLDQWIITATHRQDRTFLPPADFDPLAPTQPGGFPTEVPFPSYDIVVFENKFPSLTTPPAVPAAAGTPLTPVRTSDGICEVISYTPEVSGSFAELPFSQVRKLARVWKDRYCALRKRPGVEYVFIFENKGKEIGVTLYHPHGQIYAYPFVPPIPKEELEQEKAYLDRTGRLLMEDVIAETTAAPEAESRVVWENDTFIVFIPFFARFPYETYVAPKTHIRSLAEMSDTQLDQLAEALLVTARKLDGLFGVSMPYMMCMHQQPAADQDPAAYDYAWFHTEFYPMLRTAGKLKYLAGSESGAGAFINDTLPEVTAKTMREVEIAPLTEAL